jgi:hypothetical protein
MTIQQCNICNEYTYDWLNHTCLPSWFVWDDEKLIEEPLDVYAVTEEKAIEKILSSILNEEFDDDLRTFFVLPSNSNYFRYKEELESIQETLKDEDFFEYYDEEDRQNYEDKAKKLAASIESESEKIKQYNVQPYMTWMLKCEQITDD